MYREAKFLCYDRLPVSSCLIALSLLIFLSKPYAASGFFQNQLSNNSTSKISIKQLNSKTTIKQLYLFNNYQTTLFLKQISNNSVSEITIKQLNLSNNYQTTQPLKQLSNNSTSQTTIKQLYLFNNYQTTLFLNKYQTTQLSKISIKQPNL